VESLVHLFFFFSSRRRHTRCYRDWSSDVCSSDLAESKLRAALLAAKQVSSARIQTLKEERCNAVALLLDEADTEKQAAAASQIQIGRASCRERVEIAVDADRMSNKTNRRGEEART